MVAKFRKSGLMDGESSEWDESEHPRDEDGKFADKVANRTDTQSGHPFINIQLFASNIDNMGERQLRKSINTLNKRVQEHENKLKNPQATFPDWDEFPERRKERELRHWKKEINAFKESIQKMQKVLLKRSKK